MSVAGRVSAFEKYILVMYGLQRASALVEHRPEFESSTHPFSGENVQP